MTSSPFGSWRSPITSELVASSSMRLGDVVLSDGVAYFTESRPDDGGRAVLLGAPGDGPPFELTRAPFDVRTRVHEYGGGSFTVSRGVAYFSNVSDGRLYRVSRGGEPEPVTKPAEHRYAALQPDLRRQRLVAVLEDHGAGGHEPRNTLVSVGLDGEGRRVTLASGADFYASPRLSPDGSSLAWLEWRHPDMPWDGTELWVGSLGEDGALRGARRIAGSRTESIFQPEWGRDGTLYFVSDATGYWNLRAHRGGATRVVHAMDAEFGSPQWVFEMSTYAVLHDGRLLATWSGGGRTELGIVDPETSRLEPIPLPFTEISAVRAEGDLAVFSGAAPSIGPCLCALNLRTRAHRVVRSLSTTQVDAAYLSEPRHLTFPTTGG